MLHLGTIVIIEEDENYEETKNQRDILEKHEKYNERLKSQQPSNSIEIVLLNKTNTYPKRFVIEKLVPILDFDFVSKLKNAYVKIPFLHAIKDILIFTLKMK